MALWTSEVKVQQSRKATHVEHPALAAGALAEHGEGDHGHTAEQLVRSTEERPDVGIATKGEGEARKQGNDRGEPGVAEDLHVAGLGLDGQASLVWAKNSENEVRAMRATASSEVRARAETSWS